MTDFTWLLGGPQGSGVETASVIFTHAAAAAGYRVFGKREFHSNIKGAHSYFEVRLSDGAARSNTGRIDLMAAYDAETIFRHYVNVVPGGAVIYDTATENVEASDVPTFDANGRERVQADLRGRGLPPTVRGALDAAAKNGTTLHGVSFREILADMAERQDNPKLRSMKRLYNVLGVALSAGLVQLPREALLESIRIAFAAKAAVAELNANAAAYAYDRAVTELGGSAHVLRAIEKVPGTAIVEGYQGTAIGKMVAGCRFQSYYPITPASDESSYLEEHDVMRVEGRPQGSMLVLQAEDEMAAIAMMAGAALTGTRAATTTSGPGFSLMAEILGWASINEVPCVITMYQRSGPSTGLPTRHGQDDLLFSVFAGHGEAPRIVYASGDVEESFYDTALCFNYSDEYQVPVIHLMDKLLASSTATCPAFDPSKVTINRGKLLTRVDGEYRRFRLTEDGISPRSYLGLKDGVFWNTGFETDEAGHGSEDPGVRRKMMDKRRTKMDVLLDRVPDAEKAVRHAAGRYTVVSWGSAKGAILDALDLLRREDNVEVGFVQLKLLHPFPSECVARLLRDSEVVIDIESNQTGQLGILMRQNMHVDPDYYVLKYTGRAMTCIEVRDALRDIIGGNAPKETVLMHGP